MAFKKAFVNTYHEKPLHTKYRFAEIEIAKAIDQLTPVYGDRPAAIRAIYSLLLPNNLNKGTEWAFYEAANSFRFARPEKGEMIHYFITYGQSYTTIRNKTGVAFNTISESRFKSPHIYPVFREWDENMLACWEFIKTAFNIFNEKLIHTVPATKDQAEPEEW